ncbi:ABC transporter permease [bacterium]|nr:ABC transporter permease [bacterium]
MNLSKQIGAVATIAYRDVMKFLRDRMRIVFSLVFPVLFIGVLGGTLQSGLGAASGKDLLTYTFLGVLAQTLFQSTASGIISLIEDRENDFSQEIFVSPTSRYVIILGKIIGESTISFLQVVGILIFALLIGINITIVSFIAIIPAMIAAALLGGAFGVLVLGNLNNERTANQIFPFIMFPQFFLAGVFVPVTNTPGIILTVAKLMPLTYVVDLTRGLFFANGDVVQSDILNSPLHNLVIVACMFFLFMTLGTWLFVKKEKER